jgi:hypothetical protein
MFRAPRAQPSFQPPHLLRPPPPVAKSQPPTNRGGGCRELVARCAKNQSSLTDSGQPLVAMSAERLLPQPSSRRTSFILSTSASREEPTSHRLAGLQTDAVLGSRRPQSG